MDGPAGDVAAQAAGPTRGAGIGGQAVPTEPRATVEARRAVLDDGRGSGRTAASQGANAERSQDFLYDEEGLPR